MGTNTDDAMVTIGPLTVLVIIIACCCWCWCKCCKKRNNNSRPHVVVETRVNQPLAPTTVVHQPPPLQEPAVQPLLQHPTHMGYPPSPPPPYPGQPPPMFPPQPFPPQGYPPQMQAYPPPAPLGAGVTVNFFQQSSPPPPPNCPLPPIPQNFQSPPNLQAPPHCPLPPLPPGAENPNVFKQPEFNPDYTPSAPR